MGGRYTYYSTATGPGATTGEVNRWVFDTGVEVSAKASRLWPDAESKLLRGGWPAPHYRALHQLHLCAPTQRLRDQRDTRSSITQLPSLRLLPITFPEYNSIDSIQPENVFRFGLNNKLQTKREGQVVNFVNWDVYADWNLHPYTNQTTFSDLYSDLTFRPRSWITLESLTRYEFDGGSVADVANHHDLASHHRPELDRRPVYVRARLQRLNPDVAGHGQQSVPEHRVPLPPQRELGLAGAASVLEARTGSCRNRIIRSIAT